MNRTLQQMLRILVNDARDDWHEILPYVTMAYRATPHESTGCSPNLMMLGREINLPVDIMMGIPRRDVVDYECSTEYVQWLQTTMTRVFEVARSQLKAAAARQKTLYDRKTREASFQTGQYVWRYYPPTAKQKLGKGWVGPYRVVDTPSDIHCDIQTAPGEPTIRVHIDQLKLYRGDAPEGWEVEEEPSSSEAGSEHVYPTDSEETGGDADVSSDEPGSDPPSVRGNNRRSQRTRRAPDRLDL